MGKRKQKVAYVVLKGHQTGIFDTWEETRLATQGFKKTADAPMGPEFQGYYTREEAERAWREKRLKPDDPAVAAPAPAPKKAKVDAAPTPELRPRVDAAAAARHVAGALGAQPRHDDAARAAANDEAALRALLRDARRTAEFDEACAPPAPPPRPPVAPPAAAPGASLLAGASFRLAKRLRKR